MSCTQQKQCDRYRHNTLQLPPFLPCITLPFLSRLYQAFRQSSRRSFTSNILLQTVYLLPAGSSEGIVDCRVLIRRCVRVVCFSSVIHVHLRVAANGQLYALAHSCCVLYTNRVSCKRVSTTVESIVRAGSRLKPPL